MHGELGLKIVAEGVETQQQLDFLKRHHCDQYQEFFHSRPVKAIEVTRYLMSADVPASPMQFDHTFVIDVNATHHNQ